LLSYRNIKDALQLVEGKYRRKYRKCHSVPLTHLFGSIPSDKLYSHLGKTDAWSLGTELKSRKKVVIVKIKIPPGLLFLLRFSHFS
jgi:hypothetical protein